MFARFFVERYVPPAFLMLLVSYGCSERDVARLPQQSVEAANRQEANALDVTESVAGQGEAASGGGIIEISDSGVSEDDLIFATSSNAAEAESSVAESDKPAVLDDAFEIVERYEDGSLKRRWCARLYVTFDRARPWHQQSPGSCAEHGTYEEYYPGGQQLLVKGTFQEGKRHGEWTWWHPNGQIAKVGAYQNAKLQGEWRYLREDGTLQRNEQYDAHQKVGTWRYFDTNGETVIREEKHERDEPPPR